MASTKPKRHRWESLSDHRLLELSISELNLNIEDTVIPARMNRLYQELHRHGLNFRPHYWLSDEWFSPVDIPGVAVPFYLAHPRLMRLEDRMMLEVEGGTESSCMKLIRHEAGHALDTAFRLHRRRRFREAFGRASLPYPEVYHVRPLSKRFVLHLDWWYAQSHPSEDFAETFATWLLPKQRWRKQYMGWPAMKKLLAVEDLAATIAHERPKVQSRRRYHPLRSIHKTLRSYYQEKQDRYGSSTPEIFDRDLRRLFSVKEGRGRTRSASAFLRRSAPAIRSAVARVTGEHPYIVNHVLREMAVRARKLDLVLNRSEVTLQTETAVLVSMRTLSFIHKTGRLLIPL